MCIRDRCQIRIHCHRDSWEKIFQVKRVCSAIFPNSIVRNRVIVACICVDGTGNYISSKAYNPYLNKKSSTNSYYIRNSISATSWITRISATRSTGNNKRTWGCLLYTSTGKQARTRGRADSRTCLVRPKSQRPDHQKSHVLCRLRPDLLFTTYLPVIQPIHGRQDES